MTSLPVTRPAPDLPPGPRAALIVATGRYADVSLSQLGAAARDAAEMAEVLVDAGIGAFEVTSVVDRSAQEIRLAVQDFLEERHRDEVVVVYLSCHGLLDKQDRLYFAAQDTRKDRLAATGVEAKWLWDRLEECRAASQIVILDCCNSGAFGRSGGKGEADTDLRLHERFTTHARGRAVLTASRANQRSWEGEPVGGVTGPSVFTGALVEGLRTGAADTNGDGYVSVDEAYAYAYEKVIAGGAGQVPQKWMSEGEGDLIIARSAGGLTIVPAPLPEDLRAALDSRYPTIRVGGVNALGEWLADPDPAKVLTAEQTLQHIASSDLPAVADFARARLDVSSPGATRKRDFIPQSSPGGSTLVTRKPAVVVALAQGIPPEILSSPPSLQIENVVCIDDDAIDNETGPSAYEDGTPLGSDIADKTAEAYRDYYRKVVSHYRLLRRSGSLQFAIKTNDRRILDLYVDIQVMNSDNESGLKFLRQLPLPPAPPPRPVKPPPRRGMNRQVGITASGEGSIVVQGTQNNIYLRDNIYLHGNMAPYQEMKFSDDGTRLEFGLEVSRILPRHTVFSDDRFYLTAARTCVVIFDAMVYAGSEPPYLQKIELKIEMTDKQMTFKDILSASHV